MNQPPIILEPDVPLNGTVDVEYSGTIALVIVVRDEDSPELSCRWDIPGRSPELGCVAEGATTEMYLTLEYTPELEDQTVVGTVIDGESYSDVHVNFHLLPLGGLL
ncbi:MAG: hypothetical protein ABMB14_25890 [Myxococcota bacterium]